MHTRTETFGAVSEYMLHHVKCFGEGPAEIKHAQVYSPEICSVSVQIWKITAQ